MVAGPAGGALTGFRVVELAGPLGEWCGRLLANMGADVIKVEPPGGGASRLVGPFAGDAPDPECSLAFWHNNVSKRAVTLDIERQEGRSLLRRLVAGADVFLETLPPGEAAQLGLDYATLAAGNPRLVMCSITPFGQDGPYAGLKTTDLISMALGGPMQSCGYDAEENLPPVRPGMNHSFHTAGHFACTGILAALFERETSGQGQYLDVAAHDCLSVTLEFANTHWYYARQVLRRQTGRHAGAQPTSRTQFRCADGRYVNLGLPLGDEAWGALVGLLRENGLGEGLDAPAFADRATRLQSAGLIYDQLETLCAMHTADEIFHTGQRLGFTWGAVRAPEDWLDDPHTNARGFVVPVEQPEIGRTVRYPGAPFLSDAVTWRMERAPHAGEHNEAVYGALGLGASEIDALRQRGIV